MVREVTSDIPTIWRRILQFSHILAAGTVKQSVIPYYQPMWNSSSIYQHNQYEMWGWYSSCVHHEVGPEAESTSLLKSQIPLLILVIGAYWWYWFLFETICYTFNFCAEDNNGLSNSSIAFHKLENLWTQHTGIRIIRRRLILWREWQSVELIAFQMGWDWVIHDIEKNS